MTTTVTVTAGSVPALVQVVRFGQDASGALRETVNAAATGTYTIDDGDSVTVTQPTADAST